MVAGDKGKVVHCPCTSNVFGDTFLGKIFGEFNNFPEPCPSTSFV